MVMLMLLIICLCEVVTCDVTNADSVINGYDSLLNSPTSTLTSGNNGNQTSDIYATTVDVVRKYGYPVETHTVVTEDGYLLTVHRIPGSPRSPPSLSKKPVLLEHGAVSASDNWVLTGPKRGLGFLLADQGYDVWLGNSRGNYYSRRHVSLLPIDPAFWNFTFHEMGVYDLPAVIDHILWVTGHKQLFYIGHSMGSTKFFTMASYRPEYNRKIRLMLAMSPVVYFEMKADGQLIFFNLEIYRTLKKSGINELFQRRPEFQRSVGRICQEGRPAFRTCLSVLFSVFGGSTRRFNTTMTSVIISHIMGGISVNTLAHFAEMYATGRFQMFDPTMTQGKEMPVYDLAKVTTPVSLYYAVNDKLLHPDGVAKLKTKLPNVIQTVRVADEETSHLDFLFGTQAKKYIYDGIIALMKQYS